MAGFPEIYNRDAYVAWHAEVLSDDAPLPENLAAFIEQLKTDTEPLLKELGELLYLIRSHSERECEHQSKGLLAGKFSIPLAGVIKDQGPPKWSDLLKPADSIVNKLWRKNRGVINEGDWVRLATLRSEITDLVRTSVVAPSLYHARDFADRLKDWEKMIPEEVRKEKMPAITNIEVDDEAKFASGYFAYHSLVHFANGVVIEVQIYSQVNEAWRSVSHKLYEKIRVGEELDGGVIAPETQFVSLGHLLHLADCQLIDLVEKLKGKV